MVAAYHMLAKGAAYRNLGLKLSLTMALLNLEQSGTSRVADRGFGDRIVQGIGRQRHTAPDICAKSGWLPSNCGTVWFWRPSAILNPQITLPFDKVLEAAPASIRERVLLTGGTGFRKSLMCERLIAHGNDVPCHDDDYRTGRKGNIAHLLYHPQFEPSWHDATFLVYLEEDEILRSAYPALPILCWLDLLLSGAPYTSGRTRITPGRFHQ